jgi:hypothetical protein
MPTAIGDVLDRIEAAQQSDPLELPKDATSLDLLRAVYRCAALPLPTRIKCAIAAAQFEHPKLAVSAVVSNGSDWVKRMDEAVEASSKVIQARKVDGEWSAEPVDSAGSPVDRPQSASTHLTGKRFPNRRI